MGASAAKCRRIPGSFTTAPNALAVPTSIALPVSSVAAWCLDAWIRDFVGTGASMALSTLVSGVAFIYAKRPLSDLRGGS
jgi:hypothetical protein